MKKYETEFKLKVVESFLADEGGAKLLARHWTVPQEKIRTWVSHYRLHGIAGLQPKHGSYTASFKLQVLLRQDREKLSSRQVAAIYDIRNSNQVVVWRRTADAGGEAALDRKDGWLRLNPDLYPSSALLPNREGQAMTRFNVTQRLALAMQAAARTMPSLVGLAISPHTVRQSTAMHLLQSGVEITVIALWLGHESPTTTHQYVEADLAMKEKAQSRLQDPNVVARRFRADDSLMDFLRTL